MPFSIKQNDDRCPAGKKWSVVNSDTNKLHGCHPSKDSAQEQQKALYSNVPDASRSDDQTTVAPVAYSKGTTISI